MDQITRCYFLWDFSVSYSSLSFSHTHFPQNSFSVTAGDCFRKKKKRKVMINPTITITHSILNHAETPRDWHGNLYGLLDQVNQVFKKLKFIVLYS